MGIHPIDRQGRRRWTAVAVLLLAGATLPAGAAAFLPGDRKGPTERDCYIGLAGYSPADLGFVDKKLTKLGIRCTDCDPSCDLDGVAVPDGGCTFRIAACVNQPDVPGCGAATRTPKKISAKAKSKAGTLDLAAGLPTDVTPACGELVEFRVPLKGKRQDKPGKGKVTLVAKAPTDRDRFVFVCDPRPANEACGTTGTTTTTSPTTPSSTSTTSSTVSSSTTPTTSISTSTTSTTICVATAGAFCDLGDGTVFDAGTALQWEQKNGADSTPGSGGSDAANAHDVDNRYTWAGRCTLATTVLCQPSADAAATCAAQTGGALGCAECGGGEGTCNVNPGGAGTLTTVWEWLAQLNAAGFAGHADWRIATVSNEGDAAELESLVDATQGLCGGGSGACIAPIFGPTVAGGYWSASTFTSTPTAVWFEYFDLGTEGLISKTEGLWVRAVRTAP